ncbi:MAG TPA: hypothetical protein VNV82_23995 [Bryobacteraceae bacterium]|nr:hypothetical protein [Bryobacteraceae bacterium]
MSQRGALKAAAGAWKDDDHPELKHGAAAWVEQMRNEQDQVVEERGLQEKALMAVFLLDTTVIVDTLNGKKARYEFLDALLAQRNLLACCSINVTEVFAGVRPD